MKKYIFTFKRNFNVGYSLERAAEMRKKYTVTETIEVSGEGTTRKQRGEVLSQNSKYDYRLDSTTLDGNNFLSDDTYSIYRKLVAESKCINKYPETIRVMNNITQEEETERVDAFKETFIEYESNPYTLEYGEYNDCRQPLLVRIKRFHFEGERTVFVQSLNKKGFISIASIKKSRLENREKDAVIIERLENGELLPDIITSLFSKTEDKTEFEHFYWYTDLPLSQIIREHFTRGE